MAVLLPLMSAIPHPQNHMTDGLGQSASSGLSTHPRDVTTQSNSKRPRLSLQTTSLTNTYGALTRGLAPNSDVQATFTPTTTNTLVNTWDLSVRPSPVSRTESPRLLPTRTHTPQQPYIMTLPFGIKSILKNSPLPPRQGSISASPRDSRRKVFFPQPKRVVFKGNLEDFIETTQYVARHSDLTSGSSDGSSDEEIQPDPSSLSQNDTAASGALSSPPPSRKRKDRRDSGIYIATKTEHSQPPPSEESASATPSSESRKRRRWQWTLANRGSPISEVKALREPSDDDTVEGESLPEAPTKTDINIEEGRSPLSSDQSSAAIGDRDSVSTSRGTRSSDVADVFAEMR